ncbi:hypothetical protein [uncultured Bacteroides sp.]|uniref:hypothetical protein n=1 Tax=uncultured Bacteroides sp. TaxID=162156 RepID=UPI0025FD4426|nr:hypothetical protein [uncultured Bacteroides sp.]
MRKEKHFLYYAMTLVYGLATILIIHSCNTNEYYSDELQMEGNRIPQKSALSSGIVNNTNLLIDSITISDEFWEFERSSKLLSEKFQVYTSTLSEEEYNNLMENLNDDDYMEEFIKKANLEKQLQQMNEAKENLLLHTGFFRLSEDERISLFRQYAESYESIGKTLIKTRTEGGDTNDCETKRQAAYAQAKADYDNAIIKCRTESSTNYCYTQALANYERCKRASDRAYEECIKR